jgi:hypothetical protein
MQLSSSQMWAQFIPIGAKSSLTIAASGTTIWSWQQERDMPISATTIGRHSPLG